MSKPYSLTITVVSPGLIEAQVTWPTLEKVEVVALQAQLVKLLQTTTEWGFGAAEVSGVDPTLIAGLKGK
jgi:hypothetical protein